MHRVDVHLCAISFRARRMFSCLTEPLAVNLRKQQPVCQVEVEKTKNPKIQSNLARNQIQGRGHQQ